MNSSPFTPQTTMVFKLPAYTLTLMLIAASVRAEAPTPTYEQHIRPILKARCFHCHGEESQPKGGLDVRLRRLLVKGGESGAAIVAGKPDDSPLLERVKTGEMPPGDNTEKLSADEIALITKWIATGAKTAREEPETIAPGAYLITEEDRNFWSFQPIVQPTVPVVKNQERVRTPIDAFLLTRLESHGQAFATEADRQVLIRRAYFDLIGLPPSPEQVERFVADKSADAYPRLIDHLLASSHYGERWGRHWLDIAGYADSQGGDGDRLRQYAYRYRDYVIRSLNNDKPFDQFIREQLAGDEMVGPLKGKPTPQQAEKLIATGFLQMAPDTTGSAGDRLAAHNELVADTIKIVSSSLLGLTVGCARCHDHRFDPISQNDYYRLRAIFEPALSQRSWQGNKRLISYYTEEDRKNAALILQRLEQGVILRAVENQLRRIPANKRAAARAAFDTPEADRSEEQKQLLVDNKLNITLENVTKIDRTAMQELKRIRTQFKNQRREFLQAIQEASGRPQRTFLFARGNPKSPKHEVKPDELTILQTDNSPTITENDPSLPSSGRRLAYAKLLTDGKHPLVARVIVNRVWMHHFGQGLVTTPTDFGLEGDKPSHPELLDWLANEFMAGGWSLKKLHKLIMTSSAYRQSTQRHAGLVRIDPDNRLLGGFAIRRLEAEIVRDAILSVSGKLNTKAFGMAVPVMSDPAGEIVIGMENLNAGVSRAAIPMYGEEYRRSVYVQSRRTSQLTFMQMFDSPAMEPNCEARSTSTVAPQSLVLMNSQFMLRQSMRFAQRVRRESGKDIKKQVEHAWKLAYSRTPTSEELTDAAAFLKQRAEYFLAHPPRAIQRKDVPGSRSPNRSLQAFDLLINEAARFDADTLAMSLLCQMLMSSNEFLYVS